MKKISILSIFPFVLFLFLTLQIFAQGTIQSFTVVPPNPTEADNIEIHVDLQFSSSDCETDNQGHSVIGNSISGYTHHCLGMLTAICNTTDTFEIGQLPVGNYVFDLTLSSGFGGPGCTPGFLPDDNQQVSFEVIGSVGIEEAANSEHRIYPNPTSDLLYFEVPLEENAFLTDLSGRIAMGISANVRQVDMSSLPAGIYLLMNSGRPVRVVKL